MQGLEDQGQDLKGNTMLNRKPVKLMKDRGDVVMFLGVGGQSGSTIETRLQSVEQGFGEAKENTVAIV